MSDFPQPPPWPSPDQPAPGFPQPPPPSPSPDQPQPDFQQPPRNGLGIAALILGITGLVAGTTIPFLYWFTGILGIVGLILGFIGRGRAKRGKATNGTMALWGIITSAFVVVLLIANLVILITDWRVEFSVGPVEVVGDASPAAENTVWPAVETTPPAGLEEVFVEDLEVGDCLADSAPGGGDVFASVQSVPCSEPHSTEVYAVATLPERDFPGTDAIDAQAEELCTAEFEGFVGLSYEESVLYFAYMTPNEEGWNAGDRLLICSVFDPDSATTGTLADANR